VNIPLRSERTLRVEEFPTIALLAPVVDDVRGEIVLGIEDGSASERLMLDALQITVFFPGMRVEDVPVG
jgi:hypothetical protein